MMPTKDEYYEPRQLDNGVRREYATVGALADNGEPLLRFSGEQAVGQKIYARLKSYDTPVIGDRVILINDIILGAWVHNVK